jgi:putative transposase
MGPEVRPVDIATATGRCTLTKSFGRVEINVPRARLTAADGKATEWRGKALPAYQRRTQAADALIAGAYLAGTNTRRVRRALAASP